MEKIINIIVICFLVAGGTLLTVEATQAVAFAMGILLLVIAIFLMIGLRQAKLPKFDSSSIPEKKKWWEAIDNIDTW